MRNDVLTLFIALSLCSAPPSPGDGLTPPPQGAIYIGNGRMLEAARPRQMSLKANIVQFDYQPGGLEIAYAGMQIDGHNVTQSLRLIGLKHGDRLATLFTFTAQVNDDGTPINPGSPYLTDPTLAGWSGDGRYLMIQQDLITTSGQDEMQMDTRYSCIDVGQEPIRITPINLPLVQDHLQFYFWSPDRSSLLFADEIRVSEGDKIFHTATYAMLYDPAKNRLKTLALPDKTFTRGWLDGSHILLATKTDTTTHYFSDGLVKGDITEIAKPTKMPPLNEGSASTTPAVSPKSPMLMLEDEAKTATDEPKTATAPYHALWIRRTKGIKPLSAMSVGLTPGEDDAQARWSPTGKQIAFVAHGDLFVTDLSERDATAQEKLAAGETLTCQEEQALAVSNMKQIGLGIVQYAQDNDENYPAAAGVEDKIMPYIKINGIFDVGGHPFVYYAPPNLSMATIDSPAHTIMGTIDLPCAQIVLYADGHVKALPTAGNAGTMPSGAGR